MREKEEGRKEGRFLAKRVLEIQVVGCVSNQFIMYS